MQLTLARYDDIENYPEIDVSVVTLEVPAYPTMCSLCSNRRPVWFVAPLVVTASDDIGHTPLGGPDACKHCLNELLLTGTLVVIDINPDAF